MNFLSIGPPTSAQFVGSSKEIGPDNQSSDEIQFPFNKLPDVDERDIKWLEGFRECNLSDEEARALIVIREMGAITNADYRVINNVDTLTASCSLRKLRDLGILQMKGQGNKTYYVPTRHLFLDRALISEEATQVTPHITPHISEGTPHISEGTPLITPHISNLKEGDRPIESLFEELPKDIQIEIAKVGKKTSHDIIKKLIQKLCLLRPFRAVEISILLKRTQRYLRDFYLTPMVESGELELEFPDNPAHPFQAYWTKDDH